MRIIGITGGIGSGKSAVLSYLHNEYHAYIVETDKLAHTLMEPGNVPYNMIVDFFGSSILNEDGCINRKELGKVVFSDENKLAKLNSIVHPAVKDFIKHDIEVKRNEGLVNYYVIEAALLIEDGYGLICDELWYIFVNKDIRISRLLNGRGGTIEYWNNIIDKQSSEEYYRAHCDHIIDNSQSIEITTNLVNELLSNTI